MEEVQRDFPITIGFVRRRRVLMLGGMLDLSGVDRVGRKIIP